MLEEYIDELKLSEMAVEEPNTATMQNVVADLKNYGINTLQDLRDVLNLSDKNSMKLALGDRDPIRFRGVTIYILLADNPSKYFDNVHSGNFSVLSPQLINLIKTTNPDMNVEKLLKQHGVGLALLPEQRRPH